MDPKVIDISGKARPLQTPVPDFWFAQVDVRLGRIEFMVTRLERQLWLIFCGCAAMLVIEIIKVLTGGPL